MLNRKHISSQRRERLDIKRALFEKKSKNSCKQWKTSKLIRMKRCRLQERTKTPSDFTRRPQSTNRIKRTTTLLTIPTYILESKKLARPDWSISWQSCRLGIDLPTGYTTLGSRRHFRCDPNQNEVILLNVREMFSISNSLRYYY